MKTKSPSKPAAKSSSKPKASVLSRTEIGSEVTAAFWDSSALVPLCCVQPQTTEARRIFRKRPRQIVWWSAPTEVYSALQRLLREGLLGPTEGRHAVEAFEFLRQEWDEILPSDEVRQTAERLLRSHPLRAADALQLAAAMVWCDYQPSGRAFMCADRRLSDAAKFELPDNLSPGNLSPDNLSIDIFAPIN